MDLFNFLNPEYFPIEILNRDNITAEILEKLEDNEGEYLTLHSEYRIAVIIPTNELPEWAQRLVDERHLEHVIIAN